MVYGAIRNVFRNNDTPSNAKRFLCNGNCGTLYRMATKTNADVANKVRGIAAERRVSQATMAATLDVSRMAIHRRMSGHTPFSPEELIKLSETFDTPVGTFFGEYDNSIGARGGDAS